MIETFTEVNGFPVVGITLCGNHKQCEHFYKNFHEICNGYLLLVDYSERKGAMECPCCGDPHDAHLLGVKGYIK